MVVNPLPWLLFHAGVAGVASFATARWTRHVLAAIPGLAIAVLASLGWRHAGIDAAVAWHEWIWGPFSHGISHACHRWPVIDDFENFALGWLAPLGVAFVGSLAGWGWTRWREWSRRDP